MIADRRSQIADRNKVCDRLRSSAIIWKHTSAIVCDPAIMIADDRRRSQKIEHKGWSPYDRGSQIADRNKVCDRLRSYGNILLRSSTILRSRSQDRRRSQKCFHMIADDRRPYCDLRSAICDPRSYGNQPLRHMYAALSSVTSHFVFQ